MLLLSKNHLRAATERFSCKPFKLCFINFLQLLGVGQLLHALELIWELCGRDFSCHPYAGRHTTQSPFRHNIDAHSHLDYAVNFQILT